MYQEKYFGTFCYKDGSEVDVSISEYYEVEPPIIPDAIRIAFAGTNDQPVTLTYSDTDYKMERINGAELTIKVISDENFDLSTLNIINEKQWQVVVTGAIKFNGFLVPDNGTEPYNSSPYVITLRASDGLGLLKDVPFLNYINKRFTGFMRDDALIRVILVKTGLEINLGIAENTYSSGMLLTLCPLQQIYTNAARYYDNGGLPFSCWDVLDSVLIRARARLHQFNGKWQVVNVQELSETGSIKMWNYASNGNILAPTMIGNAIEAGGETKELRPTNAVHSTTKAFSSSTAYYQYGYPSNELLNGNFNDFSGSGLPNHWVVVGGATGATGTKPGDATDHYLKVITAPADTDRIESDTPISVRAGESVSVSFTVGVSEASYNHIVYDLYNEFVNPDVVFLASDGMSFSPFKGWGASYYSYRTGKKGSDYESGDFSIDITIAPRDIDYNLTIGFRPLNAPSGTEQIEAYYDNVEVKPSQASTNAKIAIGEYITLTSTTKQSYKSDPLVILSSDEANIKRTSFMSLSDTSFIQPGLWRRSGHVGEGLRLLEIIADTELTLHGRPYRIFEGDFVGLGVIDINTIVTIENLPGTYLFLCGTFDFKKGIHTLRLAEITTDEVPRTSEFIQDYGNLTKKDGVSVGAPNGISVGPGTSNTDTGTIVVPVKATAAEVTAGSDDTKFLTPLRLAGRLTAWWASIKSVAQIITGNWVFKGVVTVQRSTNIETYMSIDCEGGSLNMRAFNKLNAVYLPHIYYQSNLTTEREVGRFDVNGRFEAIQFKLKNHNTAPASATATGELGEVRFDANFIYYCVAANTWRRAALVTW